MVGSIWQFSGATGVEIAVMSEMAKGTGEDGPELVGHAGSFWMRNNRL
jgi:hypothetical protein